MHPSHCIDHADAMGRRAVGQPAPRKPNRTSYAKVWEGRIAEGNFVLGELNQGLFLDQTLAYWSDLNRKIEKLTVANVNVALKEFIDPTKLAKVRAGDRAKKR
jgi:hypothetical protein